MEIRTFEDIEVRVTSAAAISGPEVTLQAIKPGVVDAYGSLWNARAFDASLAKRLPVLCWAHDWSRPLGPGVDYTPTSNGPKIRFKFSNFDAVPDAKSAHAQVMDGTIRDCSVGFSNADRRAPTNDERSRYPGVREVIERGNLDEVSLVIVGAVPGAEVVSVRSAPRHLDGAIVDRRGALRVRHLRRLGQITDQQAHEQMERLIRAPRTADVIHLGLDEFIDRALAIADRHR